MKKVVIIFESQLYENGDSAAYPFGPRIASYGFYYDYNKAQEVAKNNIKTCGGLWPVEVVTRKLALVTGNKILLLEKVSDQFFFEIPCNEVSETGGCSDDIKNIKVFTVASKTLLKDFRLEFSSKIKEKLSIGYNFFSIEIPHNEGIYYADMKSEPITIN